jgi:phytanoyl-CoA hydroxylase
VQVWQRLDLDPLAARFVADGYVIGEQLVSADDVEALRADAERFADGGYPVTNLPADGRLLAVHFPHWVSPVAQRMVTHPGLVDVLSRITGAHLPYWDGGVKCMQTMLFLKPPGLPGQAWHQDERYIPTRDRSLVGAWIALDDATIENGCLWVVPGSHRAGVLLPTAAHGRPDEFDPSDEAQGVDDTQAVPVELRTGDVVFFNGYLLHRSLRNRSAGTRRALVNHYMSSASNLPWLVHQGLDIGTADNRAVTVVHGSDHGAWKGTTPTPDAVFVRPADGDWSVPDRR